MSRTHTVAIVGGGPAGALAGALLAESGRDVVLFDEKLAWEKPCGGGLTHKALQRYPFLAEAGTESNSIEHCELISPSGQRARFRMAHPVAIFSRLALNGLMLKRAGRAGVDIHHERVTRITKVSGASTQGKSIDGESRDSQLPDSEWQLSTPQREYRASTVVLAAGARNHFRSQFLSPVAPNDLMVTAGYFIPTVSSVMQIQFLKTITGYIWVFPRADHVSAGIAGKMGETPTSELRRVLEHWLEEHGYVLGGAQFYSHILPSFRPQTFESLEVCGDGWAMIGDSAGLVDPITGEGLYYALRSAELCAEAILAGQPQAYSASLEEEVLPELKLAARVSQRFYTGKVFGDSVLEKMISLTAKSATFRELMSDLFAGIQGYQDLRPRLIGILPSLMAEGLGLRRPWGNGRQNLTGDPLAE
jgi:geranylgeranyl diphosphate/geranylgeranyl-bacteriochlorophyllide a reductase